MVTEGVATQRGQKIMEAAFPDYPEALANTVDIAERCNLEIELGALKLPVFPIPTEFQEPDSYLRYLCEQGLP